MIDRRVLSAALVAGAAPSLVSRRGGTVAAALPKARNFLLLHGLFADGSC